MKIENVRSRSALARIILSKVDPKGTKYRITKIAYKNPATLDGTIVTVNRIADNAETRVLFKKYRHFFILMVFLKKRRFLYGIF